ncbi:hypothetical protein G6F32_016002 [Rhizopus arrhizus]|nr:hypothetical protein G6F32_016002 [Rhizopus arrhizus]
MVDGQLLCNRQVHGQMQEGVGARLFHRIFHGHGIGAFQIAVVFGMLDDPVQRHGLARGQHLVGAVLAPGVDEEFADLVAGRIEHRRGREYGL